jgi:TolC family type I secretion outer membrane protein
VPELSLPAAVATALRENPEIEAARSQEEIAAQRTRQARAGALPRLGLSESFQRTNNPAAVFAHKLGQERFGLSDFAIDRLNHPNAVSNFATHLTATWPLYDGGRTWHGWRQAREGREAAALGLTRTRQTVIARTTAAYTAALMARESLAVVERAMAAARAHLAAAATRHAAGLAVKSDWLQAQVRLADLEQQSLAAESGIAVAQAALCDAMGVPLGRRFSLAAELAAGPQPEGPVEQWVAIALNRRPDLRELAAREAMAREEVGKARAAHLPSLALVGDYQVNTGDFESSGDNYSLGAVVSVTLFAGLGPSAQVAEAEAAVRQFQALRRQAESRVTLEARRAHALAQSAFQRIAVTRQAVAQAEEAVRIVGNRYENGLLTIVELLGAAAALQQARTLHTQSLHDTALAEVNLRLAAGVLEEGPGGLE